MSGSDRSRNVSKRPLARLLQHLAAGPAEMVATPEGVFVGLSGPASGRGLSLEAGVLEMALSRGLVTRTGRSVALSPAAEAYLRRGPGADFRAQHGALEAAGQGAPDGQRIDRAASPLAALARLKDKGGQPFLPEAAILAGERRALDFTRGQLQPKVTASLTPRLETRAAGTRGRQAELSDLAVSARLRVDRAVRAMGPELAGVALDICCFGKGLELVERERQWPARSAKLLLRAALMALARHYAPPPAKGDLRHWGTEDYRPDL